MREKEKKRGNHTQRLYDPKEFRKKRKGRMRRKILEKYRSTAARFHAERGKGESYPALSLYEWKRKKGNDAEYSHLLYDSPETRGKEKRGRKRHFRVNITAPTKKKEPPPTRLPLSSASAAPLEKQKKGRKGANSKSA